MLACGARSLDDDLVACSRCFLPLVLLQPESETQCDRGKRLHPPLSCPRTQAVNPFACPLARIMPVRCTPRPAFSYFSATPTRADIHEGVLSPAGQPEAVGVTCELLKRAPLLGGHMRVGACTGLRRSTAQDPRFLSQRRYVLISMAKFQYMCIRILCSLTTFSFVLAPSRNDSQHSNISFSGV